ncbi:hypothetical protein ACG5V6_26045 [Streptomyces chitinivorans]|uniref:DUF308 domain-containing protein n=1 Tax=Streptomyces chitinivorans TaxID=1257027 RepID=A0ABW7I0W8_9ACTN|nr:hypothetical protein [Streptomyces chitinivorans]MDH2407113.1 hypothetical protein [Streptomyces chitinivorans]
MTEREQGRGEGPEPLDEEAAWAQIVAAYGEEPASPPEEERRGGRSGGGDGEGGAEGPGGDGEGDGERSGPAAGDPPVRGFTVYAAGSGPRDWSPAEPSDDDLGEDDEGHFVPPEPPPLPKGDPASRFAWLAVLGGPLLLMLTILFQQPVTWWIATLGIGGFLGGFAALVMRMRDEEDDDFEDPGRGAVV